MLYFNCEYSIYFSKFSVKILAYHHAFYISKFIKYTSIFTSATRKGCVLIQGSSIPRPQPTTDLWRGSKPGVEKMSNCLHKKLHLREQRALALHLNGALHGSALCLRKWSFIHEPKRLPLMI